MTRFLGFLAVLLSLPFSLARAAIVPGPEIAPTQTVLAPPAFDQFSPRLASSGNGFLAIWTETASASLAVHATRVSVDGTPLDQPPMVIADAPDGEWGADVIWDGRRYLVLWVREGVGVFGRFVETDGAMSEPFRISEPPPYRASYAFPRVAFNGRVFLVAWTDYVTTAKFRGAIVDAGGQVTKQLELGEAYTWSNLSAVAAVNEAFFFVTSDIDYHALDGPIADLGITRIDEDGSIGSRVVAGSMRTDPTASTDFVQLQAESRGHDALVAWTNREKTYSVRITSAGIGEVQSFDGHLNALVPDRAGYLLVYDDASGHHVRRAGAGTSTPIASLPGESVVVSGADNLLLTSSAPNERYYGGALGFDVYLQRLDDDTFTPVTTAPRHQTSPHMAAAGSLRLAAWTEVRDQRLTVVAARIGVQGTQLDPEGIDLGARIRANVVEPRVAAGAGQWLIVWHQGDRVAGSRVAFDGTLLDAEPFTVAERVFYADIFTPAWDGTRFVVVFTRGFPTKLGGAFSVMAARVGTNGVVESPEIRLSASGPNTVPAIAGGRDGSLVVWRDRNTGMLHGALLSRSGAVTPIALPPTRVQADVAVAWNGETFLVAAPVLNEFIRWFFVSATGVVTLAPASAYATPISPFRVPLDVEPHGDGFFLAYEHEHLIYAATINRSGYIAHGPVAVAMTTIYDWRVSAAGTTIIYARPDDPLRARTSRVVLKELAITPNPPKRRAVS